MLVCPPPGENESRPKGRSRFPDDVLVLRRSRRRLSSRLPAREAIENIRGPRGLINASSRSLARSRPHITLSYSAKPIGAPGNAIYTFLSSRRNELLVSFPVTHRGVLSPRRGSMVAHFLLPSTNGRFDFSLDLMTVVRHRIKKSQKIENQALVSPLLVVMSRRHLDTEK